MADTPKPVDLCVMAGIKIDGKHHDKGEILEKVEPALALELAGQGRARVATDDDRKAAAAAAKAAKG